jgi:hypothetical protein
LIASALVGPVLARSGDPEAFVAALHVAAGASAAVIAAGAMITAVMIREGKAARRPG